MPRNRQGIVVDTGGISPRGHRLRVFLVFGFCGRCAGGFSQKMTTKARKYCVDCGPIVEKERSRVSRNLSRQRERERDATAPRSKRPRLIPYAGYDKGEEL
jgi:PHP family Zn ribbon phosphoesterase